MLHKEATVLKLAGDWNGAVAKLELAKKIMLLENRVYTEGMWTRLAKFLQYAGRYDESMKEFDFLMSDLERRIKDQHGIDDPTVSYGKESKRMLARRAIRIHSAMLRREREVVEAREMRKLKKLEKQKVPKGAATK